jgi:hypothetical protein
MTKEQRDVLAHVVADPDAWMAHAVATFGQETAERFLQDKVARWRDAYLLARSREREGYADRAQRDARASPLRVTAEAATAPRRSRSKKKPARAKAAKRSKAKATKRSRGKAAERSR